MNEQKAMSLSDLTHSDNSVDFSSDVPEVYLSASDKMSIASRSEDINMPGSATMFDSKGNISESAPVTLQFNNLQHSMQSRIETARERAAEMESLKNQAELEQVREEEEEDEREAMETLNENQNLIASKGTGTHANYEEATSISTPNAFESKPEVVETAEAEEVSEVHMAAAPNIQETVKPTVDQTKAEDVEDEKDEEITENAIKDIIDNAGKSMEDDDAEEVEEDAEKEKLAKAEAEADFIRRVNEALNHKTYSKEDLRSMKVVLGPTHSLNTPFIDTDRSKSVAFPLMNSGKVIIAKACNADDIGTFAAFTQENANVKDNVDMLFVLYNMVLNPNKGTFEEWLRYTPAADIFGYFDAAYCASFIGSNYCRMDCENKKDAKGEPCHYIALSPEFDALQSINFDLEEDKVKVEQAKQRFNEVMNIYNLDIASTNSTDMDALSDRIAISFHKPSMYEHYVAKSSYGKNFTAKYEKYLGIIEIIDKMYKIKDGHLELIPYTEVPNNPLKTAKNKIKVYSQVIKELTVDELNALNNIYEDAVTGTYALASFKSPETVCPRCGATIKSVNLPGIWMLFGRVRLTTLRA